MESLATLWIELFILSSGVPCYISFNKMLILETFNNDISNSTLNYLNSDADFNVGAKMVLFSC